MSKIGFMPRPQDHPCGAYHPHGRGQRGGGDNIYTCFVERRYNTSSLKLKKHAHTRNKQKTTKEQEDNTTKNKHTQNKRREMSTWSRQETRPRDKRTRRVSGRSPPTPIAVSSMLQVEEKLKRVYMPSDFSFKTNSNSNSNEALRSRVIKGKTLR